jgi:hypothetical protein
MPHEALHWESYDIGFDLGILGSASEDREAKKALEIGRKKKEEVMARGRSNVSHRKCADKDRSQYK